MLYDWLQNIEFKYIWVLPFLGMLPVFAFLHFRTAAVRKSSFTVSSIEAFKVRTGKNILLHFPFWLRLLCLGCIILALARPQVRNTSTQTRGEGIDIILCMDVSGSMLSADFYPNRMEVAKELAADFVQSRPVDQIGLVIFSGESYTQYPLSTDHESLLQQIKSIKSGMLMDGTLIGEGLATSVQRLTAGKSKSKVVILLTDGKEEAPKNRIIDPNTALAIAKRKGVKVYSIGMAGTAPVASTEKGKTTKTDPLLDEALLRQIAAQTGGLYFRAKDRESLQDIYRQIDRLEKSKYDIVTKTRVEEWFIPFLLIALLLLALEVLLRYTFLRTFP
ncbi:MAG: VWA domain-containing protein [Bacteroidota bacterium]|nr:VWA domain-containing protein [Bacteroidota bacterium]